MSSTRKTSERPSPAYNLSDTEAATAAEAAEAAEAVIEVAEAAEAAFRFGGGVAAAAEVAEAVGAGAIK
jgi:phosphoribosylformimino-5-aminoimidazole carboxamide ribonucleotide (ProFAR) isomerase